MQTITTIGFDIAKSERLRRAPRQKSIAVRTPGPMRQFKPSAGRYVNAFKQRKFRMSMKRMRAKAKQLDHGICAIVKFKVTSISCDANTGP